MSQLISVRRALDQKSLALQKYADAGYKVSHTYILHMGAIIVRCQSIIHSSTHPLTHSPTHPPTHPPTNAPQAGNLTMTQIQKLYQTNADSIVSSWWDLHIQLIHPTTADGGYPVWWLTSPDVGYMDGPRMATLRVSNVTSVISYKDAKTKPKRPHSVDANTRNDIESESTSGVGNVANSARRDDKHDKKNIYVAADDDCLRMRSRDELKRALDSYLKTPANGPEDTTRRARSANGVSERAQRCVLEVCGGSARQTVGTDCVMECLKQEYK